MGMNLVVSDKKGRIYGVPGLEPAGMEGGLFFRLGPDELTALPPESRLFMLPDRLPVYCDADTRSFAAMTGDSRAVAAFLPPGYTSTYNAAYVEGPGARTLPLFSYAAVSLSRGKFFVSGIRVDRDRRHDARFVDCGLLERRIRMFRKVFGRNRLVRHLEDCALIHQCPNARNFFLSRYEAPLPTSPHCNASCAGCISYQSSKELPPTQPRIGFTPTPEEVSDIALYHIENVKDPIVSFGQGCEGEPLLAGNVIERSVRMIRAKTSRGTININTNASRPKVLARLFDAGINSVRVSMNSARPEYYSRYYLPRGYGFKGVLKSILIAKSKGVFVSINYLTMPGFTDSLPEFKALKGLLGKYAIDMIQWRNLNFDPMKYFEILRISPRREELLGVRKLMTMLKREFPKLRMGYFNPRATASPRR